MNQLTISENNALNLIPLGLKDFCIARIGKPFNDLSEALKTNVCLDVIAKAHFDAGDKGGIDKEVLKFQSSALKEELKGKYGILTVEEIKRAFFIGIRGEAGAYFGMCPKTYSQFLKHYYEKPERVNAMNEYLKVLKQDNEVKPNPDEVLTKNKQSCLYFFTHYKKNGEILNGHAKVYDLLWKDLGLIKWTKEQRLEMREPVEKEYIKTLENAVKRGHMKHSDLKGMVDNLGTNATFIGMLKRAGLKKYFDSIEKLEL